MHRSEQYRCLDCKEEWKGYKGPNDCPHCGSRFVKWLNYKQVYEEKWKTT